VVQGCHAPDVVHGGMRNAPACRRQGLKIVE